MKKIFWLLALGALGSAAMAATLSAAARNAAEQPAAKAR
jgi:hypothetical protein